MRRKVRKTKILYAALALCLMLTGCTSNGNNSNTNEGTSNTNTSNSNSNVVSDNGREVVTITTARQVGGDVKFKNGEDIDNNVQNKWAKEKLGINIKNEWTVGTGDAYTTKLRLMLNTNEKLPDVFRLGDLNLAAQLIDSGKIMDITDAFEQYASPRLKDLFQKYPQLWYPVTVDGKHGCGAKL